MAEIFESEIIQGDTGPMWQIGVPSLDLDGNSSGYEDLTNYTCTMVFTDEAGVEQVRSVTSTNQAGNRFLAQLNSADSDTLKLGVARMVLQVKDDAGVPYRSEIQIDLTVKKQRYEE
jgi:hypothetical protein